MNAWPLWFKALLFGVFWNGLYVALRYALKPWYLGRKVGSYVDLNRRQNT